jgi:hypothetical protein
LFICSYFGLVNEETLRKQKYPKISNNSFIKVGDTKVYLLRHGSHRKTISIDLKDLQLHPEQFQNFRGVFTTFTKSQSDQHLSD